MQALPCDDADAIAYMKMGQMQYYASLRRRRRPAALRLPACLDITPQLPRELQASLATAARYLPRRIGRTASFRTPGATPRRESRRRERAGTAPSASPEKSTAAKPLAAGRMAERGPQAREAFDRADASPPRPIRRGDALAAIAKTDIL